MHTKNPHIINPMYRPDIDGLRSIAIISVVLFHAFRNNFRGGFIGVDIFFVISGFLISTIIFSSLEKNRFSIVEFYTRRIRRIFPALIFVLVMSVILAWFVLLPDEYERIGKHLVAGVGFVSNLVFWRENGYFDTASEAKPLLHLWSLAIEEQFYLFWPILLAIIWRQGISFLYITIGIAILSFAANIYLMSDHPVASFYLPISRFWELMMGGVLSFVFLHYSSLIKKYRNVQSFAGFSLLFIGFSLLNQERDFPGWWALLPVFGTFFIISAGPNAWLNENLLSNKLMIGIGKISYPMYLWHWPLLSFAYIYTNGNIGFSTVIFVLILTVVLSLATYFYIEKPVRFGKFKSHSTPLLLASMVGLLVIGFLVAYGIISPRNTSPALHRIVEARNDDWSFKDNFKKFHFGKEIFHLSKGARSDVTVFLGDSHTNQYLPRVSYLMANHPDELNTLLFATHEGCLPIPGILQNDTKHKVCNNYRNSLAEVLSNKNIKTVILGGCWSCYLIPHKKSDNELIESEAYASEDKQRKAFASLKDFLVSMGKSKTVYLLLDNPIGDEFNPSYYLQGNRFAGFFAENMPLSIQISAEQLELRAQLKSIAKQTNTKIIDPIDDLCQNNMCLSATGDGEPIYRDGNHLRASYIRKHVFYIDNALMGDK